MTKETLSTTKPWTTNPTSTATTTTSTTIIAQSCTQSPLSLEIKLVNSHVIHLGWTKASSRKDILYNVKLFQNGALMTSEDKRATECTFSDLFPSTKYSVSIEAVSCSEKTTASLSIMTAGKIYTGKTRIINVVYKEGYENSLSEAFKDFEKNFQDELKKLLPSNIGTLLGNGMMRIELISLKRGSVVVDFNIVMSTEQNVTLAELSKEYTGALNRSTVLQVDLKDTFIDVTNSCLPGLNDCSENAICTPVGATYTCACKPGFKDASVGHPGRICEDINECTDGSNACSFLAQCTNTIGSYKCECYKSIQEENSTNPGTKCTDPVMCFNHGNLCRNTSYCFLSKPSVCSRKQAFACNILFKTWTFAPELYNPASDAYANMSNKFILDIVPLMRAKLKDDSFDITIVGFRPGSVQAYFFCLMDGTLPINASKLQLTLSEAVKATLAVETEVTAISIPTSSAVTTSPTAVTISPSTAAASASVQDYGWRTAVIVIAVLLAVALLVIVGAVLASVYWRRRTGKYFTDPSGIMGNFSYKYM
ncbi:hypothetical protein NDU88_001133 [Pleurodeles waltl]|uniref:Uncharacterized protein n=2 Tax=Pleurodeles waltl TaxID=8319 RepID=A0AAV7N9X2_PLEWA|nr:hypothetical protein NDU88_001133 [Pleurodeles waltl]